MAKTEEALLPTATTETGGLFPARGWLARYVDLFAPHSEAPKFAHLATGMAMLSAAVGWRAWLQWGESQEPTTLFLILEGRSAISRKTTTAFTAGSMIKEAMASLPEDMLEHPPLRMRSMSHVSHVGLMETVGTGNEQTAQRWDREPPPSEVWVWDEFGAILGKPGDLKGADWLGRVRTTLMEMYGGRHGGCKTRQTTIHPSRCAVSMIATMTRQELEDRVRLGLLRDGFMGRFILVPYPGRERYLGVPPKLTRLDKMEKDTLQDFLRGIVMSRALVGNVFDRMTPDAKAYRVKWYQDRMTELDKAADEGDLIDVAVAEAMGRLQSTAVKIATTLAVSELMEADNTRLDNLQITLENVVGGISFVEYALEEIRSLAYTARVNQHPEGLQRPYRQRVLNYLINNGRDDDGNYVAVSRSTIMNAVRDHNMNRTERWEAIKQMHVDGLVTIQEITPVGGKGRPATTVALTRPPLGDREYPLNADDA